MLLIDSFVMTTLFYPALALQLQRSARSRSSSSSSTSTSSSRSSSSSSASPIPPTPPHPHLSRKSHSHEDPLSLLSTPLLDSFFPYPEPAFEFGEFPRFFWELDDGGTGSSPSASTSSSSASKSVGSGGASGIVKEDTWGPNSNSTWIVEDVQSGKSGGGSGTFDFDIGTSIGDSSSGTTTTRIIAAPIVWTDVQTVLTTSRLFGGSPTNSFDDDGKGGTRRGDGGMKSAGSSAVDERLAQVVDELGRRPGVRSATCFDPVTGQKIRSGACLSRGDARDESTASGVVYLKVEQEQAIRSGFTTRSIEDVWQDVSREVEKGSGREVGMIIESSRLGQVEGRTRSVSVRVSRDFRACVESRTAIQAGTVLSSGLGLLIASVCLQLGFDAKFTPASPKPKRDSLAHNRPLRRARHIPPGAPLPGHQCAFSVRSRLYRRGRARLLIYHVVQRDGPSRIRGREKGVQGRRSDRAVLHPAVRHSHRRRGEHVGDRQGSLQRARLVFGPGQGRFGTRQGRAQLAVHIHIRHRHPQRHRLLCQARAGQGFLPICQHPHRRPFLDVDHVLPYGPLHRLPAVGIGRPAEASFGNTYPEGSHGEQPANKQQRPISRHERPYEKRKPDFGFRQFDMDRRSKEGLEGENGERWQSDPASDTSHRAVLCQRVSRCTPDTDLTRKTRRCPRTCHTYPIRCQ